MQPDCHPYGGSTTATTVPRAKLAVALGMFALLAACASIAGCRPASPPPSVLLIVVDTLRADHVGALYRPAAGEAYPGPARGGAFPSPARGGAFDARRPSPTPSIDLWARRAARFRHATTPAPFTMPAMAALLSGVYPDRCGVAAHEPGTSFHSWPGTTMAEAARKAGLATAAVVANPWLARTTTGFDRGIDEFSRLYRPGQVAGTSVAAAVTDNAIRILEGIGDRRFLLWVHYFDPHMPYEPPAEFALAAGAAAAPSRVMSDFNTRGRDLRRLYLGDGYTPAEIEQARRLYEGEVRYADHEIGRLLEKLESLGLEDGTLVIIASDHGESLGEHGLYFAHDYTLYEELTRVALLVRGPGVAAGDRDDSVSLLDVAPTVCRLAGLVCPTDFDGRDLFNSPRIGRTLFAAATPLRTRGTPFDRLQVPGMAGRWTMALTGTRKFLRIPTAAGTVFETYDLSTDPDELANLAATEAGRCEALAAELAAWSAAMDVARPAVATQARSRKQRHDTKTLRSLGYLQ